MNADYRIRNGALCLELEIQFLNLDLTTTPRKNIHPKKIMTNFLIRNWTLEDRGFIRLPRSMDIFFKGFLGRCAPKMRAQN